MSGNPKARRRPVEQVRDDVPPFAPERAHLTPDGRVHELRVHADAYRYVRRHGLAVDFRAIAREYVAVHPDRVERVPTERERFGF
ncbi:hypothetical protein HC028_18525 [Planosporangium flavigriseum]|uniref:Uncharacterized protein n=1 Tax=Planosporangium flavigriseum TaxID=373681 RepID=A0A8J3PQR0_9ACTN|nr:hypothetical protein [Planosporangium flavigriseum]NJC66484.1 hypothetical protein [Planosporangium flavigriseum]GIG76361.1 hypothetical protein Pfl04_47650 [Planosporangium flavigriseum]